MKKNLLRLAVMASLTAGAGMLQAGTVFDANLASPNTTLANDATNPAFYDGSGNPNGGFKVVTDSLSGIELGLRAKDRQNPSVIHSTDGTYIVPVGAQTNVTSGNNGASATHAAWNYEFSIDLRPNGVGNLTMADIAGITSLTVTDVTQGASFTVNPLIYFPDDSGYGAHGLGSTLTAKDSPESASDWGAQNSENPEFASFPLTFGVLGYTYNMNAFDTYTFTLAVGSLATDSITVEVAPLPSSAWGGLALLGGLGMMTGFKRFKRQTA